MTAAGLLALFRLQVHDTAIPYLWSDDEVYKYIAEAQNQFCRETDGIADASSAVCSITATAATAFSSVSPFIKTIRKATTAAGRPITLLNVEDNDIQGRSVALTTTQGALLTGYLGLEDYKIRWEPIPAATETVTLAVYRLPMVTVAANTELEIPAEFHFGLLNYVMYLAYLKHDAETFDRTKAEEFATRADEFHANAKHIQAQRKHKPRIIAYGGI